MRIISALFFLFLPMISFAQSRNEIPAYENAAKYFPLKNGSIYYESVVEVDSVKKDELYKRVINWGINTYNSQKDASQIIDKESGIITYTGWFRKSLMGVKVYGVKINDLRQVWYTVKFYFKDGKAKCVIDNIKIRSEIYNGSINSGWTDYWYIERFSDSYKSKKPVKNLIEANNKYFYELDLEFKDTMKKIEQVLKTPAPEFGGF